MKDQFYKSQKVIEANVSILRRWGFYRALSVTALATALGLASSPRAAAQFPSSPGATVAPSFACFQVNVDPSLPINLTIMNPGTGPYNNPYPGWLNPYLTSPGLNDSAEMYTIASGPYSGTYIGTVIGESAGFSLSSLPGAYPIQISCTGSCTPSYPQIPGLDLFNYYGNNPTLQYPSPGSFAWLFPSPSDGNAMFTEIQAMDLLSSSSAAECTPTSVLLGPAPSGSTPLEVKGGWEYFADPNRRTVGMAVSASPSSDFPAKSFFNVYVEVSLPAIPGTESMHVFPTVNGNQVCRLINTAPLIVENDNLTSLPNGSNAVFYVHSSATPNADLYYEDDNPGWWLKGQHFGTIQLAGHGIFTPCDPGNPSADWTNFITKVMGVPGHSPPRAPVGGMFPSTEYLWPSSTYSMVMGSNFAGQALDALTFTNVTTVSAAYLTFSNFQSPISLPSFGSSVTYTNTNTLVSVGWSARGLTNYITSQSTGTVAVLLMNTNPVVNGQVTYNTTLLELNTAGTSFFGQYAFRLNPGATNSGAHLVQSGAWGNRIAGYFDTSLQFSADGGATWNSADAPVRLYLGDAPCGSGIEPLYVSQSGTNTSILDWGNPSYALEYSTSLSPAVWVSIPGTPPITVTNTGPARFYRLTCE